MGPWIDRFLSVMETEQMASRNTVMAYRRDLRAFREYMGSHALSMA